MKNIIRNTRRRAVALALSAALCPLFAQGAPFLLADAYPPDSATALQPDSASITINGGAPIACALLSVTTPANGKRPVCDLASVTSSGTYAVVLTVSRAPSCVNTGPNAGECTPGGSAATGPFAYMRKSGTVGAPQSPQLSAQ